MKFNVLALFAVLAVFASIAFAGSIAGHVDDGSAYLNGASVTAILVSNGTQYGPSITNASGFFNVTGLPDGNYNVTASAAGYYNRTQTYMNPLGESYVNNSNPARTDYYFAFSNFTLISMPPGNLSGFILNTSGSGVGGAGVNLYVAGVLQHSTTTDVVTGAYQFANIEPRTYEMRVTPPAIYSDATVPGVIVESGKTVARNVTVFPAPVNGSISGTVYNSTGGTEPGATIQVVQGTTVRASTVSLAGGAYSIATLAPGIYNMTAFKANYTSQTITNVLVSSGAATLADFVINPIPPGANLTYVSITPNPVNVTAGVGQQFTATAHYTDGSTQIVTAQANWTLASGTGSITASGYYNATIGGNAVVRATFLNQTNTSSLTVQPGPLARITVTPNPGTMYYPNTLHFTANGFDAFGNFIGAVADAQLGWSVTPTGLGGIDANGLFTPLTLGNGVITAVTGSNTSINASANANVQQQQQGGGGGAGGFGGGGDSSGTVNLSYIGQPCRTSTDCFYGQCINSVCKVPEQLPNQTTAFLTYNGTGQAPPAGNATGKPKALLSVPQTIEKGSEVEATLLTLEGAPIANARIDVTPPIDPAFTITTNANGKAFYKALREGTYDYDTPDYELDKKASTRSVSITTPPVQPQAQPNVTVNITGPLVIPPSDLVGSLFNALRSGANNLANAVGSSLPVWIVVGVILFAAVLLIVVYMVLYGIKKSEQNAHGKEDKISLEEEGETTSITEASKGVTDRDLESLSLEKTEPVEETPETEEFEPKKTEREEDLENLTKELEDRLERLRKKRREAG